ncbi:DNA-processing protein DprA [Leadbettera azotonutricia]|uniref:Smf protein n=1 Tax=Leadbettera azotonutricia (strain ATCC BAA-888 / DSM 13862 / ZAS-9) TaxID=545695 RepID=F5YFK0_LEAAZ|nr:DNA-processing protein DprA [Leadbettera azotonutricia]AEF80166.1 Smf protein [Leadbettera azotonutricia ZAS-9]
MEEATREIIAIAPGDPLYPVNLGKISGKLRTLYALGNTALLGETFAAAVVGTTTPSEAAKAACAETTSFLVEKGFVIVSGLAAGCDTIAHQSCLDAGGKTIAVLAHGLDICYPRSNLNLRDAILEKGGLLLSEYPPGTKPRKNFFVARDRIQSGLSRGIVVIETDVTGGTMHTARFAEKQKRLIGCIVSQARGNKELLKENKALPLKTAMEKDTFIISMKILDIKSHEPDKKSQMELF